MDLYRSKHSDKKYPNSNSSSNDRPSRSFRNSRDNDREDTTVTCADCGEQCTIPFVPKLIGQFTAVIALDNTNQIILTMTDHQETTEVQDIQETTDHQETTEVQEILEIMTEKIQL